MEGFIFWTAAVVVGGGMFWNLFVDWYNRRR
jgi:hypothetical protein